MSGELCLSWCTIASVHRGLKVIGLPWLELIAHTVLSVNSNLNTTQEIYVACLKQLPHYASAVTKVVPVCIQFAVSVKVVHN